MLQQAYLENGGSINLFVSPFVLWMCDWQFDLGLDLCTCGVSEVHGYSLCMQMCTYTDTQMITLHLLDTEKPRAPVQQKKRQHMYRSLSGILTRKHHN